METVTVSSEEFKSTDLDKEKTSSPKGLKTVTVSSEEFKAADRYGDIPSFSPTGERISELPEKDTTDLLGYGYAKSRTLTGEAGRWLHDVAVGALDSDMTIEEVRQKREAERQEEIFEDYPWARTGEYDTNPWVVTGEIGGSLVDPLTLLPGVAAVKTAHTASTALKVGRATFTGGSEAYLYSTLLQENTEGKVDQSEAATVGLFGAAFGGSVGWGSLKLKSWYDNYKKVHGKDPNVIEIQDFLLANEIEFSPVEKGGYNIGAVPETLKESDKSIKYKRIGGTYDYLGELEYKELNSINKQIDELHLKTPSERWDEVKRLNENHNQAEEAYRNGKMDVEDWDAHRASYNTRVISTFEDILNKSADIKIKGLENIFESSKKADLTDHALTQIMNVVTRPIFGGGAGYSLGMIQGDPGDEVNYMLIGASLGALQKAVRSSRRIDNTTKKKLDALINVSGLRHIRNIYHNLSSSTHAAHLNSRQGQALKVWSRANFHQQVESGAGKGKGAIRGTREASVEERATLAEGAWMNALFTDVFKRTDSLADREAAVRVMWGFGSKEDKAKPEVRHIVKGLKHFLSEFQEYHQTAGIKQGAEYTNFFFRTFKTAEISMDKEGFSRDVYKIFLGKKNPKTGKYYTAKEARKLTRNYVKGTSTRNKATGDKGSDDFIFDGIPLLRHIETQRQLTGTYLDRVTGKEMSVEHGLQDWLVMDPAVVLRDVIPQSTKAVEFARTWGPNGELIKVIKGGIHSHHNAIGLGKAQQREKSYDLQLLRESIDAMFGQHGESIKASGIREAFAWLNGAVNMNMLETVSIANLGDLLQIWQNSSLKSAYQAMPKPFSKRGATALRAKDETGLAKTLAIDVSDALSRELKTMIGSNSDTVLLQKGQEGFFTLTGLRGVTSLARRWAFNVGTHEAYNLSVKYAKLSTKQLTKGKAKLLRQKLNFLGITPDEALKIGKVSSYEDIMNSSDSEILTLIKQAGFRTAERDAKIPTVGNRRLFTQSNNEAVRMLGGLLSWAQAKGTQMNGLLSRIEGGDKVLAVKVAAMLPVYASLMGFRKWLESGMEGGVDGLIESTPENLMAEGMLFSGAIPWQVTTTYSPLEGYTKDNPLAMFPATNLLAKASKAVQGEGYWRDTLPLPKLWKLMFGDPREERQTVPSYGLPQKESKPTYSTGGYVSEMSQLGFNEGGVASSREANATLSDQLISLGKKGGEYIDETIDRAKTLVTPSAWVEALTTFPKVDLETEELPEYDMETIMNSLPITGITKPAHMMLLKMKKNPNLTIENRIKALKKLGKVDRKTESKELLDILSDIKVDYPEMAKGYQAQIAKVMNTPAPKVTSKDIAEQLKKTKTKPKKSKQPTSEQANIAHVPNMSQATFAKQVAKFDSKVDDIINNGTRREINKLLYEQVGNRKGTEAFAIDKFHLALKKREYQEKLARDRAYRAQREQRKAWRESRDEIRGKPKDKKYKHGGLFSQFAGGGAVEQQMHKL